MKLPQEELWHRWVDQASITVDECHLVEERREDPDRTCHRHQFPKDHEVCLLDTPNPRFLFQEGQGGPYVEGNEWSAESLWMEEARAARSKALVWGTVAKLRVVPAYLIALNAMVWYGTGVRIPFGGPLSAFHWGLLAGMGGGDPTWVVPGLLFTYFGSNGVIDMFRSGALIKLVAGGGLTAFVSSQAVYYVFHQARTETEKALAPHGRRYTQHLYDSAWKRLGIDLDDRFEKALADGNGEGVERLITEAKRLLKHAHQQGWMRLFKRGTYERLVHPTCERIVNLEGHECQLDIDRLESAFKEYHSTRRGPCHTIYDCLRRARANIEDPAAPIRADLEERVARYDKILLPYIKGKEADYQQFAIELDALSARVQAAYQKWRLGEPPQLEELEATTLATLANASQARNALEGAEHKIGALFSALEMKQEQRLAEARRTGEGGDQGGSVRESDAFEKLQAKLQRLKKAFTEPDRNGLSLYSAYDEAYQIYWPYENPQELEELFVLAQYYKDEWSGIPALLESLGKGEILPRDFCTRIGEIVYKPVIRIREFKNPRFQLVVDAYFLRKEGWKRDLKASFSRPDLLGSGSSSPPVEPHRSSSPPDGSSSEEDQ